MIKKSHLVLLLIFCVAVFLMVLLRPKQIAKPKFEKYNETQSVMSTYASVDTCLDGTPQSEILAAYREMWTLFQDISWRMNVYDERSEVTKINKSFETPAMVSGDTYDVIQKAIYYNNLTEGAFDITVEPLIELWQNGQKLNVLPQLEEIREVKKAVGSGNIQLLAQNQIRLLNPQSKIDLGGIAAGYAIDQAVSIFHKHAIQNFYIDLGGDIYAGGVNCEGYAWRVGIIDPRDKTNILDIVELSNAAITTSGNYEKYYEINGEKWSHIMDPTTGYPQKDVISATVIAPTAIDADVLPKALCVFGEPKGTALIDRLGEGYAGILFYKDANNGLRRVETQRYINYQFKK